jgi:methylmalonyl-CoA mutase cobalamin-binding subunit
VLVVGIEGDEHPLELQMMHDQLSAAGYRTILDAHVAVSALSAAVESHSPDVVVLGSASPGSEEELDSALRELRASRGELPIVLGAAVAGGATYRGDDGMRALERIDESVRAVDELLAAGVPAAAR